MRTRLAIAITGISTALMLGAMSIPAYATQQQVCGNGGSGYCMNDWNGVGDGPVKMYNGGNSNEDFYATNVYDCNGSTADTVQAEQDGDPSNCPFSTVSLDNQFEGYTIIQVNYGGHPGECIGGTGNDTDLVSCGADGSYYILLGNQIGCSGDYLVNRYFSDGDGDGVPESIESSGVKGGVLYNDISLNDSTCWGGL
jgi:hypothetical protein